MSDPQRTIEVDGDGGAAQRTAVALLVALLAALLYLPGLGRGDFVGDDESLDAGVVWEMAHGGGWLFPEFNGEYLPPKPPLFYWAARSAAALHGRVDEWALRAPSALAGIGLATLTAAAGAPLVGAGPAALGAVLLAASPIARGEARLGRCDMLLAVLTAAALFLVGQAGEAPLGRRRRLGFWTLLGLGAICKGGAGVGLVAAVVLAQAAVARSSRPIRAVIGPEIAAFVLIAGAWYGAATWHWGQRFVDEQILGENLNRLFGGEGISDKGSGTRSLAYHLGYYPLNLVLGTLPWSLLLVLGFDARGRDPLRRGDRFLWIWVGAGLLFFTLVSRKSPYYLLPLAPATCLLAARYAYPRVREAIAAGFPPRPIGRGAAAAIGALAIAAWLMSRAAEGRGCTAGALAEGIGRHPLISVAATSLALLGVVVLAGAAARRSIGEAVLAAVMVVVGAFLVIGQVEGPLDDCVSLAPFASEVRAAAGPGDRLYFFEQPLPAVVLYARRRIATIRDVSAPPPFPFLLVLPESLEDLVPRRWLAASEVLTSKRARVFTRRAMRIRLLRVHDPAATRAAG